MDGMSFIRVFSLGIVHKWVPEQPYMILTAYLDESGTGGSPLLSVGGFLATAEQWESFESRLHELQETYGFRTFHGKDLKAKRGEFSRWSTEKVLKLVIELDDLARNHLLVGAVAPLNMERYKREYRDGPKPRHAPYESAYGLCFRQCLIYFLTVASRRKIFGDAVLNIIAESGSPNSGDALRIFEENKESMMVHGDPPILGTLIFADKAENDLLMVADFLVYTRNLGMNQIANGIADAGASFVGPPLPWLVQLGIENLGALSAHLDHMHMERKRHRAVIKKAAKASR